ncbi:MAG: zinc ribbon domain-containing protein [Planctomycetaceae bacterium]|nr:zinc ribbon domain-containing protein [Planctomycetaceae bacterium]
MPTYDYQCLKCERTFEKFQSITSRPGATCPGCGSRKVRRLIGTGAGIIFKGSGFYCTDYRSDSYKASAKKESPAASSDTASKDKPAADKPAPAAPAAKPDKPSAAK